MPRRSRTRNGGHRRYLVVLPDKFADLQPCRKAYALLAEAIADVVDHRRAGRFARLWDYQKGEWVIVATSANDLGSSDPADPN